MNQISSPQPRTASDILVTRSPASPMRNLQRTVAAHYDISLAAMLSPNRSRRIARARQVAMWIAREEYGRSLSDIGRAFNRDHTTVTHAVGTITRLIQSLPEFALEVSEVRQLCVSPVLAAA